MADPASAPAAAAAATPGVADFPAVVVAIIVGATALVLVYVSSLLRKSRTIPTDTPKSADSEASSSPPTSTSRKDKAEKAVRKKHNDKRETKQPFKHMWLMTTLKGHTGQVLDMDFSSDGNFLVTCGDDRAVFIWNTKDWPYKEHKSVRCNVLYDHASFVRWSPDSTAFVIHKAGENTREVYRVAWKKDGWVSKITPAITYPREQDENIVGFGMACNGKFLMTCSEKTELILWDIKGQKIARVDTYLMSTLCARISPCGRFVVASGFTPDVKVWEVAFTKSGEFQAVNRAFELSGHSSGVYEVDFNADSSRMATVSKDGTWKVFDTNIEYKKGEDPHLIVTSKYAHRSPITHIAMTPDGEVVAVSSGNTVSFFSVLTGECDMTIDNIYTGPITALRFDAMGKYLLTTGEKHIHVFHNVTGYRVRIVSLRSKLRQSLSTTLKERLEQQIKDAEDFLKSIGTST